MSLRKAAEMALEFVAWVASDDHSIKPKHKAPEIAEALRKALAQPEQEPVEKNMTLACPAYLHGYTAPPKREWVGLTEEEVHLLWMDMGGRPKINGYDFSKAIEAKLKEKNT